MNNFYNPSANKLAVNQFLVKTYYYMGFAVLVSALAAYLTLRLAPGLALSIGFGWITFFISLIIAFTFTHVTLKNAGLGMAMMLIFSVLEGMSLSSLAFAYTSSTITGAFVSASAIFIGMAFLGTTTKMDLTKFGPYLFVGLLGVIIVSLVNILLLKNTGLSFVLSLISVVIFTGYTAYDAQQAVRSYDRLSGYGISEESIAIINAFNLYLDFDNLFLNLLQIFGILNDNN